MALRTASSDSTSTLETCRTSTEEEQEIISVSNVQKAEQEHLPNFIDNKETANLLGVATHCEMENGKPLVTLTVRWLDKSTEALEKWMLINKTVTNPNTISRMLSFSIKNRVFHRLCWT
ncbi:hypothetical protein KIN20_032269 [Parelaphostrongylus tenuis]|uniref:Uncharacterized protein n=1 Tax=Parelaphostrongylus tenuis TaxID=148309 RepID=A0AAD5R6R9_PARTN|nr:hypothetical protein KIN20_032269 [Parelaphostrongylus tenuis]